MSKRHQVFKSAVLSSASLAAMLATPKPAAVLGSVRNEFNPGDVEKLLKDVKSELDRISGDVKRTAEDALRQSKDNGTLSADVKQTADKLITTVGQLGDAQTKLTQKLEDLETRNRDIEQKIADTLRQGQKDQGKSAGEVISTHDDLRQYLTRGAKGSVVIGVNQAITSLSTSAGGLIVTERDPDIV